MPKTQWGEYVQRSLIEALMAVFLFWIIYEFHNIGIVSSIASDPAFSTISKLSSDIEASDTNDTQILVYTVDKQYFEDKGLLDEQNHTNYGESFPRSKLAEFVAVFDKLPETRQPLSLYIDYNMVDGTASYDHNDTVDHISQDDMLFLEQLSKIRHYRILIPKNRSSTIVESYAKIGNDDISQRLSDKIINGEIIFVSASFLMSNNTVCTRYDPMATDENHTKYYHEALINWQLHKHGEVNETEISQKYNPKNYLDQAKVEKHGLAVVNSNIIYKNTSEPDNYNNRKSKWAGLVFKSAWSLVNDTQDSYADTIVMIGVGFEKRTKATTSIGTEENSITRHANALKTVLFLDGHLELVNLYLGFLIVFILFFLFTILARYLLPKISNSVKKAVEFFIVTAIALFGIFSVYVLMGNGWATWLIGIVVVLGVVLYYRMVKSPSWFDFLIESASLSTIMILVSYLFLFIYHEWFNWFIPILVYYSYDFFSFLRQAKLNDQENSK